MTLGPPSADSPVSAESLAVDLELAKAELRTLRAERDRLKAGMAQLRAVEAERDRLREALTEFERKPAALKNRSPSRK
ncbi:hypothetical protein GCM10022419_114490 [Nonomuraea rosea]|uniref:Uncharacterized protein n=1 Tax=Nonomuraea rosea TaxID=638574 RepID=A0ABP6ZM52_9ACTN